MIKLVTWSTCFAAYRQRRGDDCLSFLSLFQRQSCRVRKQHGKITLFGRFHNDGYDHGVMTTICLKTVQTFSLLYKISRDSDRDSDRDRDAVSVTVMPRQWQWPWQWQWQWQWKWYHDGLQAMSEKLCVDTDTRTLCQMETTKKTFYIAITKLWYNKCCWAEDKHVTAVAGTCVSALKKNKVPRKHFWTHAFQTGLAIQLHTLLATSVSKRRLLQNLFCYRQLEFFLNFTVTAIWSDAYLFWV